MVRLNPIPTKSCQKLAMGRVWFSSQSASDVEVPLERRYMKNPNDNHNEKFKEKLKRRRRKSKEKAEKLVVSCA